MKTLLLLNFTLLLLTCGCSSLANVGIGPGANESIGGSFTPFGGVQHSSARVSEGWQSITNSGLQFYIPVVSESMGLAALADVPLSLVGDVVTLPVCWWKQNERQPSPTQPIAAPTPDSSVR